MLTHRQQQLLLLKDAWSKWHQEAIQDLLLDLGPITAADYLFLESATTDWDDGPSGS